MDQENRHCPGTDADRGITARHRASFTILELLIVVAVIAILTALLLPALHQARARAMEATCAGQQKQILMACLMYADGQAGWFPTALYGNGPQFGNDGGNLTILNTTTDPKHWTGFALLYFTGILPDKKIFYCPTGKLKPNDPQYGFARANFQFHSVYYTYSTYYYLGSFYNSSEANYSAKNIRRCMGPNFRRRAVREPKTIVDVPPSQETLVMDQVVNLTKDQLTFDGRYNHGQGNTIRGCNEGYVDGHVAWKNAYQLTCDGGIKLYTGYLWR